MSEMMDMFKELVTTNGDEVAMDEPPCVLWRSEHPNCKGCPYGLGCGKMTSLGIVFMQSLIYQPNSFEDFQKMERNILRLQEMVLGAKTVEELHRIPMV